MLVQPAVGKWLDYSHGAYAPIFVICGSTYLIALFIMHLLLPTRPQVRSAQAGSDFSTDLRPRQGIRHRLQCTGP